MKRFLRKLLPEFRLMPRNSSFKFDNDPDHGAIVVSNDMDKIFCFGGGLRTPSTLLVIIDLDVCATEGCVSYICMHALDQTCMRTKATQNKESRHWRSEIATSATT